MSGPVRVWWERRGYLVPLCLAAYVPATAGHPWHSVAASSALIWSVGRLGGAVLSRGERFAALFLAWGWAGAFWSADPSAAVHESAALSVAFFLFLAGRRVFDRGPEERRLLGVALAGLAAWKALESMAGPGTSPWMPAFRGVPNGNFLGMILVVGVAVHPTEGKRAPWLRGGLAGAALWLAWRMNLSATWIAVAGAWGIPRAMRSRRAWVRFAPVAVVALLAGAAVWQGAPAWLQNNPGNPDRLERLTIWSDAGRYAADHFLAGTGPGSFGQHYPQYQTLPGHRRVYYAHNEYLQMLCEYGIIGWVLLGLAVGPAALRLARGGAGPPGMVVALGLLGLWAGADFVFRADASLFAAALLAAAVLPGGAIEKSPGGWDRAVVGGLAGLALAAVSLQGASLVLHGRGKALLAGGDAARALSSFETGFRFNPLDAHLLFDQAECLVALDRRKDALARLEKALTLRPRDLWARRRMAILRLQFDGAEAGLAAYAPLVSLAPAVAQFWKELGDLLSWAGRADEARRCFERAGVLTPAQGGR